MTALIYQVSSRTVGAPPMPDVPSDALAVIGATIGVLVGVLALWKATGTLRARVARSVRRVGRAVDVVLGTPAMPDPDNPGELLKEATPDMGVRMTRQEALLQEVLIGVVEEARQTAQASLATATTAAEGVAVLTRKVDLLAEQVGQWQDRDRVKAETATSVLHEVVRTIPPAVDGKDRSEAS